MSFTSEYKKAQQTEAPKNMLFEAIYYASKSQSYKNIAEKANMTEQELEDIMLGVKELTIEDMILLSEAIDYKLIFNMIPLSA